MSSKFGENSKPAANSEAYRNSAFWDKKEESITLDFKTEELSGQLFANSEKCGFTSYWIDEGAWCYLVVSTLTCHGPILTKREPFNTLEDAKKAAQEKEDLL